MKANQIRKKYLKFMEERGHKIVPSASLLPENDPTTLFTGSGMQPMVPYLLGEKYPGGEKRIANSQKCFRSGDIEEVGDNRHTTFFEMLGNWSLGDYFKKEQIEWVFEFLTKELKLDPKRIYVSVYRGNEKFNLPEEKEAVKVWQEQFNTALRSQTNADGTRTNSENIEIKTVDMIELQQQGVNLKGKCLIAPQSRTDANLTRTNTENARNKVSKLENSDFNQNSKFKIPASSVDRQNSNRIFYYPDSENWWSRAGAPNKMPEGEPGGPDSEIFWDFGPELKLHERSQWKDQPCHPACDCGRFMEIGNSVFMQYKKTANGFEELKQKNIDFGGGLERLTAAVNDTPDVFLIDLFEGARKRLMKLSRFEYGDDEDKTKSMRVILDHLRAATFLINDGAEPSNKDQGYFTRRLIRRAVRFGYQLGIEENFTKEIVKTFIETYGDYYTDLRENEERIYRVIEEEEEKFRKTLVKGLKRFKIYDLRLKNDGVKITGKDIFDLYQTYGFPMEMSFEELEKAKIKFNKEKLQKEFLEELQKHRDLSRTASAGKFKGGLVDNDEATTQLHTVAHLMLAGLRKVLGESVSQKGSNITPERIRFDFSFDRAMTEEEKQEVEKFVNDALRSGAKVELTEMPKQQAMDEGVTGAFWEKYPEQAKVYTITAPDGTIYSRELCGGPHIKNLSEIKGKFKIMKEKSSGAGTRRIKASLRDAD